ncbi:hypothetical protein BV898_05379 [Hypsibius exemplaris]|uniref:Cystatin domain-containing protein n=1 Tax=Hypsibius exemplaris TaxID=2072580 RepID=A0A1W0WZB7_HYPEX|nr:hypothetical protein BV898_05379 [Hypsibius exemplaris]
MHSLILRSALVMMALVCASTLASDVAHVQLPGGPSQEKIGDPQAQAIADAVKPEVQTKLGAAQELQEYVVEKYTTQVVAGTNYFLKIRTAPNHYIHARVFKPLPHTKAQPQLHSVQSGKQLGDKISYF